MSLSSRLVPLVLVSALASCASEPPAAPAPAGADSPKALFERLRAAESEGDDTELLENIAPDQRALSVFMMWFDAAYRSVGAEPEVVSAYRALVQRHALDERWLEGEPGGDPDPSETAARALQGKALDDLWGDLLAFQREQDPDGGFGFEGEIEVVQSDGLRATVGLGGSRYECLRQGDRWYWILFPPMDS